MDSCRKVLPDSLKPIINARENVSFCAILSIDVLLLFGRGVGFQPSKMYNVVLFLFLLTSSRHSHVWSLHYHPNYIGWAPYIHISDIYIYTFRRSGEWRVSHVAVGFLWPISCVEWAVRFKGFVSLARSEGISCRGEVCSSQINQIRSKSPQMGKLSDVLALLSCCPWLNYIPRSPTHGGAKGKGGWKSVRARSSRMLNWAETRHSRISPTCGNVKNFFLALPKALKCLRNNFAYTYSIMFELMLGLDRRTGMSSNWLICLFKPHKFWDSWSVLSASNK